MYDLNALQKQLKEWQARNFPADMSRVELLALGVAEEAGELCHHVLKGIQGIRSGKNGMDKEQVADAVADVMIYGMQILSKLDMKAETVLDKTATDVLGRDWIINPDGEGFGQPPQEEKKYQG